MKLDKERLIAAAELASGLNRDEILGKKQHPRYVVARHSLWYIARHIGLSYPEIGYQFGMRDHTTIMNGVQRASEWMATGDERSNMVERIVELYS